LSRKRLIVSVALASILAATMLAQLGCGQKEGGAKEPIRIGVVLSESGANEPLGKPERNAIKLFVKRLNESGGIDGHDVEVIIKDDQSDSTKAQQAAIELLEQEEVVALIGSSGFLEISVRDGSAAECLAVGPGARVVVRAS